MVTFHTKTRDGRKAKTWAIEAAACLLLAATLIDGGKAQVVEATPRVSIDFRSAKQITVSGVHHGIEDGPAEDPIANMCRTFRVSPRQVKLFLRTSRTISSEEFDHGWEWLPCYATGTAKVDQVSVEWKISASGVAKVWLLTNHDSELILGCDEDCQRRVFKKTRGRERGEH
jgi:hypothetical protein